MTNVVLDASAAAEIVASTVKGRRLLSLTPGPQRWSVPDHFHLETAGALRRMLNKGVLTEQRAERALTRLTTLPVSVSLTFPFLRDTWAYRHNLVLQDAAYVVLAQHLDAPLLTADGNLARVPNLPIQVLHLSVAE